MKCETCNHIYDDTLEACPVCGEPRPGASREACQEAEAAPQKTFLPEDDDKASSPYKSATGTASGASQRESHSGAAAYQENSGQGSYGADSYSTSGPSVPSGAAAAAAVAPAERKGGTAPLVLGILSILAPYVGLVLGILAIVFGNAARRTNEKGSADYGMATAGWIMGIVACCIQGLIIVLAVVAAIAVHSFIGAGLSCLGSGLEMIPWWY